MESSDVARFLIKKYLLSCGYDEDKSSSSSDPILARFKAIGKELNDNSTALTNTGSVQWLSDLNNALTDWQFLKDQKSISRIFSKRTDFIAKRLSDIEGSLQPLLRASISDCIIQPNLLHFDRYTFYKPNPIDARDVSDVEHEKLLLNWLLTLPADGFKAAGIYGTGGSGKTSLVKNVLKQKNVGDKFKIITWACLSQSTRKEEIEVQDLRIMEYLLYRLGLDTDNLVGNDHNNRDWLEGEVKRRLMNLRNYYILVLDDMWLCSNWFADEFLGKILKKIGGGAVIVTSRIKTVAEKIGDKNMIIHLQHNPIDAHDVSDYEYEKVLLNWLLTLPADGFKAAGIYGTGGSGKTSLVKNVLKQKNVGDKFKRIIWVCLSQSTRKEEIELQDLRIMEYLLYRLGLDTDNLVGSDHNNRDWLEGEVKSRLMNLRNYYILVLDDMWLCSDWFADEFLGKILKKIGGGAVIVTSRRKTVAEKIGDKNMIIPLQPSAYWKNVYDGMVLGD